MQKHVGKRNELVEADSAVQQFAGWPHPGQEMPQFVHPFSRCGPYADRACDSPTVEELRDRFVEEFEAFDKELLECYESHRLDADDFRLRTQLKDELERIVRKCVINEADKAELHIVGSSASGCGLHASDLDIVLVVSNAKGECVRNKDAIISYLDLLAEGLRGYRSDLVFTNVQVIRSASVPIVKLTAEMGDSKIEADISANQFDSVDNTHLLRHFARQTVETLQPKIDVRFPTMCVLIKRWARSRGLRGSGCGTFSSYALNLLVLHYLTFASDPPVLPNLFQLHPGFFRPSDANRFVSKCDTLPSALPDRPVNARSVSELLLDFFDYYAHFDFANYAISIPHCCCSYRPDFVEDCRSPILILDPYQTDNPTKRITWKTFPLVAQAFRSTRDALFCPSKGPSYEALGLDSVPDERPSKRQRMLNKYRGVSLDFDDELDESAGDDDELPMETGEIDFNDHEWPPLGAVQKRRNGTVGSIDTCDKTGPNGDQLGFLRSIFGTEFETLDEELLRCYETSRLDGPAVEARVELRMCLERIIRKALESKSRTTSQVSLTIVGSTSTGCGLRDSGMDLALMVTNARGEYGTSKGAITSKLGKVNRALQNCTDDTEFTDVGVVRNVSIPFLTLMAQLGERKIRANIRVNPFRSLDKTHLLRHFAKYWIDARFPMLCVLVKRWARSKGINSGRKGTFTSYAINLLVLHYLTCASDPPVMPNLLQLYPRFFRPVEFGWNAKERDALPHPLPARPMNTRSASELLLGFFNYYAHFDFANYAISIPQCSRLNRAKFAKRSRHPIQIIDPYQGQNPARHVSVDTFPQVLEAFRSTRDALFSEFKGPTFGALGLAGESDDDLAEDGGENLSETDEDLDGDDDQCLAQGIGGMRIEDEEKEPVCVRK